MQLCAAVFCAEQPVGKRSSGTMMVLRALQRTAPVRAYARSLETHPLPTSARRAAH